MRCAGCVAPEGNEDVRDAGRTDVIKRGELRTIDAIKEQDAATKDLALADGPERPRCDDLPGMHCHFEIALDLFDLMGRHDDRAAAIEVVVQQRIVELLALQKVEAEGRLVKDQQLRIDGHDQREVKLGDHAFRQLPDLVGALDGSLRKKSFRLGAVKSWMDAGDVVERLRDPYPARQHGDVGDEQTSRMSWSRSVQGSRPSTLSSPW